MKWLTILAMLVLVGCGNGGSDSSCTNANVPNVQGNWTGPISSSLFGDGDMTVVLSQNNDCLDGQYTSVFPSVSGTGTMTGTIASSGNFSVDLTSAVGACPTTATGIATSTGINGSYNTVNCTPAEVGSFSLARF